MQKGNRRGKSFAERFEQAKVNEFFNMLGF